MNKIEMSAAELEMANFDIASLQQDVETAKLGIATTESVDDIKQRICVVWSKIRKFVKMAENVPVVGKYISLLSNLLDAICG